MKFDELTKSAKERARNKYREHHLDHGWWEFIYEDAIVTAKLMGITIGTFGRGKSARPDIWFSGFYSQGDGCCFGGGLSISGMKGALARINEHAPQDEKLHRLATCAEVIYTSFLSECVVQRLEGVSKGQVNTDMVILIQGQGHGYHTYVNLDDGTISKELENDLDQLVSEFARWIYKQLEAEYEYQTSDEVIDKALEDYEFDSDGSLLKL